MTGAAAAPLLEARALECVRGERRLFRDLSFAVAAGDLLRIGGPNGSGKTSLLRILCGLSTPESGSVHFRGEPLADVRDAYFTELVYAGHAPAIKDDLTPIENLQARVALAGVSLDAAAAAEALARFGLRTQAALPARNLSQGQRRRVMLARLAVAPRATVWILDEPFAALDAAAVTFVESLVAGHLERGGAALVTTHQETALVAGSARRIELGAA